MKKKNIKTALLPLYGTKGVEQYRGRGRAYLVSFFLFSFSAHFDFLFDINRIRLGSNKGFVIRQRTYGLTDWLAGLLHFMPVL